MSGAAFDNTELSGHGFKLLEHMGEWVRVRAAPLGDPCSLSSLLISDITTRDVQSAQSFASGFFPPSCASARAAAIAVANASNGFAYVASDNETQCGSGPTAAEIELRFGSVSALTNRYRPQMRRVSEILGCCSEALCHRYGRTAPGNCTIDELPYHFDGTYWQGLYDGPLAATGAFAGAWMLQYVSGFEAAWGEVGIDELQELYRVHNRMMLLGSNLNRSVSASSHLLGFILASLEQLVPPAEGGPSAPLAGAPPSRPQLTAVFAHDFNLLYLRQLLRLSWLTDSWPFDAATTGSSISFELHRDEPQSGGAAAYRVLGVLESASITQQASASPLVLPHPPPARSVFLDQPLSAFRAAALGALDTRCVAPPLRATIEEMQRADAGDGNAWLSLLHSGEALAVGVLLLVAGCGFGFLAGRASRFQRTAASHPLLGNPKPPEMPFYLDPPPPAPGAPALLEGADDNARAAAGTGPPRA